MSAKKKDPLEPSPNDSLRKPGNIDLNAFSPEIWRTQGEGWLCPNYKSSPHPSEELQWKGVNGGWKELLVCRNRAVHGRNLKEDRLSAQHPVNSETPEGPMTTEIHYFPVAIVLTFPVAIFYGLPGNCESERRMWTTDDVKTRGLGVREAQAALASAWRGVDEIDSNWPNRNRLRFKYSAPFRTLGVNTDKPQDLTLLRDVAIWINWRNWDNHKISMKRRAEIIESWGYPCTLKALRQVKDGAGI